MYLNMGSSVYLAMYFWKPAIKIYYYYYYYYYYHKGQPGNRETSHGYALRATFQNIMTSSNGNIFRVTGHLCGEFTGPRWIPHTKASDAELWCFLWSVSEYTIE